MFRWRQRLSAICSIQCFITAQTPHVLAILQFLPLKACHELGVFGRRHLYLSVWLCER